MNPMLLMLPIVREYGWLDPYGCFAYLRHRNRPPAERKCLLPGCGKMTSHRGGYCSAEHCKQHK